MRGCLPMLNANMNASTNANTDVRTANGMTCSLQCTHNLMVRARARLASFALISQTVYVVIASVRCKSTLFLATQPSVPMTASALLVTAYVCFYLVGPVTDCGFPNDDARRQ